MLRAHLSAVDHVAKLVSPVRIGTSSEILGFAKLLLLLEDMLMKLMSALMKRHCGDDCRKESGTSVNTVC